jgi:hypothetical protein
VDGEIPAATLKKIVTLAGDMQEAQMGLSTAEVKRLCAEVTHIIHSAASISFTDPVMCLMAQNYDVSSCNYNFSINFCCKWFLTVWHLLSD